MGELSHSLLTGCIQGRIPEYVVSDYRYYIYEDVGPIFYIRITPLSFVLFDAWPVAIGIVSFFYCGEYS